MQIKLLQQSIQQARSDAEKAGEDSSYILEELKTPKMILQGHGPGGDLRKLLKQKQPSLLAWLLGPLTNVISVRVRYCRTHAPFAKSDTGVDWYGCVLLPSTLGATVLLLYCIVA